MIELRWSAGTDSAGLAALHREAWRYAYAGIIPDPALERMVARRGPRWWQAMHAGGGTALVLDLASPDGPEAQDGPEQLPAAVGLGGYATLGPARLRGRRSGEIYELYLRPDCQGIGFGRRLFEAARARLVQGGLRRLVVWSLADNATACRFYRAMGGIEAARSRDRIGGVPLDKVGFTWG